MLIHLTTQPLWVAFFDINFLRCDKNMQERIIVTLNSALNISNSAGWILLWSWGQPHARGVWSSDWCTHTSCHACPGRLDCGASSGIMCRNCWCVLIHSYGVSQICIFVSYFIDKYIFLHLFLFIFRLPQLHVITIYAMITKIVWFPA